MVYCVLLVWKNRIISLNGCGVKDYFGYGKIVVIVFVKCLFVGCLVFWVWG